MKIYSCLLIAILAFIKTEAGVYTIQVPTRVEETGKHFLVADLHSLDTTVAKPVILIQTPYNRLLYRLAGKLPPQAGGLGFKYDLEDYHVVIIDWRGFYGSKDAAVSGYDRGLDGYDAVEWIAAQNWCNGKIGTCGGSALGQVQFQTARHNPPHLVCAVPAIKDYKTLYTNYYYGCVFRKEHVESLEKLGFVTTNAILAVNQYNKLWQKVEDSSDYSDEFHVPMLLISGWFDHYPSDVHRAFYDIRRNSDGAVRNLHKLIFGPWTHSGVGQEEQGDLLFPEAKGTADEATMKFFERYLLGVENNWEQEPVIKYFMMGANEWRTCNNWYDVKQGTIKYWLHPSGALRTEPVTVAETAPDTIVYDPRKPSPTDGGSRFNPFDTTVRTGPVDIRSTVESRKDILIYQTDVLTENLELTGGAVVHLWLSSDRTDTDIAVRLCDVYPDGRSIILTQAIQRMRYRKDPMVPGLLAPGEPSVVEVGLEQMAHTFKAGHRMKIILSGSDYPMFDINLNNGGDLYKPGDTLVATNLVLRNSVYESYITLPTAKPVSVENESRNTSYSWATVAGNPATDDILIRFGEPVAEHVDVSIYDLQGKMVIQNNTCIVDPGSNSLRIPIPGLVPGIYILNIRSGVRTYSVMISAVR